MEEGTWSNDERGLVWHEGLWTHDQVNGWVFNGGHWIAVTAWVLSLLVITTAVLWYSWKQRKRR